jgi:hypothetical protein
MIGNAQDASIALTQRSNRPKDGWKLLGEGCSRSAFLSPAGIVYKICHYSDDVANHAEIKNYKMLKSCTLKYCRIAETTMYEVDARAVIAMEYIHINDIYSCSEEDLFSIKHELYVIAKIYDIHEENVGIDSDGTFVVFDYAN